MLTKRLKSLPHGKKKVVSIDNCTNPLSRSRGGELLSSKVLLATRYERWVIEVTL